MLVGVSVWFGSGTWPQLFFMGAVACLFALVQIRLLPYKRLEDGMQQTAADIGLFFTIFTTAFLKIAQDAGALADQEMYYIVLNIVLFYGYKRY